MSGDAKGGIRAKAMLLLAVVVIAFTALRAPAALHFAAGKGAVSFELRTGLVRIAFDIGRECSISDRGGELLG